MPVSDEGYQHIEHGFEPVFDRRSRVLVLGSFPSVLSRANAFYYGNPQNRFWRVMAACLGAPVPPNEGDSLGERRARDARRLDCCQAGYAAQRRCGPVGRDRELRH